MNPSDKMFWVKVSPDAHRIIQDNIDRLRVYVGVGMMKVELAKNSDPSMANKRSRPQDGEDTEERPVRTARRALTRSSTQSRRLARPPRVTGRSIGP